MRAKKNCYLVVRFSGTPYRLIPSEKALRTWHQETATHRERPWRPRARISTCSEG